MLYIKRARPGQPRPLTCRHTCMYCSMVFGKPKWIMPLMSLLSSPIPSATVAQMTLMRLSRNFLRDLDRRSVGIPLW